MKFLDKKNLSLTGRSYKIRDKLFSLIRDALTQNDVAQVKELLLDLHYADIADLIDNLGEEKRRKLFEIIDNKFDALILVELHPEVKNITHDIIGSEVFASKINELDTDNAIYVLEALNRDKQLNILSFLSEKKSDVINRGLSYPKNSAGRIMNRSIVAISDNFTVDQTITYLQNAKDLPNDFYEIFIVDNNDKIIAGVQISRLMRANPEISICDIADKNIIIINSHTDQEEISYLFKQYSLVAAPVVNNENILIGVINIEDILEVMGAEAEEDIRKMVGVGETDFHADKFTVAKKRFPWLFINLLTACITSIVIDLFGSTIEHLVALAAIMPIVASLGGNAGSQTLTVAVRAIANRELDISDARKTIFKEIYANLTNGVILAILGAIIILLWQHNIGLGLVFAASIIINFAIAGFLGAVIPIMLTKLGADPAVASSVFLTALTDLVGFFAFLGLASLFLV